MCSCLKTSFVPTLPLPTRAHTPDVPRPSSLMTVNTIGTNVYAMAMDDTWCDVFLSLDRISCSICTIPCEEQSALMSWSPCTTPLSRPSRTHTSRGWVLVFFLYRLLLRPYSKTKREWPLISQSALCRSVEHFRATCWYPHGYYAVLVIIHECFWSWRYGLYVIHLVFLWLK